MDFNRCSPCIRALSWQPDYSRQLQHPSALSHTESRFLTGGCGLGPGRKGQQREGGHWARIPSPSALQLPLHVGFLDSGAADPRLFPPQVDTGIGAQQTA